MSVTPLWVRTCRHLLALLVVAAVATQYRFSRSTTGVDPVNFFSFFTIQSNLLLVPLWLLGGGDRMRAAVTLYLSITGAVYALLLSGLEASLQTQVPWVNLVLHQLTPLAVVLDWILVPPGRPLSWRRMLPLFGYPLLYLAYSLVRGGLVGWYPYPFLDPGGPGGYGGVAWVSLLIALGTVLAALVVAWVGNLRLRQVAARQGRRAPFV